MVALAVSLALSIHLPGTHSAIVCVVVSIVCGKGIANMVMGSRKVDDLRLRDEERLFVGLLSCLSCGRDALQMRLIQYLSSDPVRSMNVGFAMKRGFFRAFSYQASSSDRRPDNS